MIAGGAFAFVGVAAALEKVYKHTVIQKKQLIPSSVRLALQVIIVTAAVIGCAGSQTGEKMKSQDRFAPCPDTPNCVSSEAQDPRHAVAPMQLSGDSDTEWADVQAVVSRLPRTRIVTATDRYLHVTVKSRFFGFVDDMELMLDPSSGMISIRSASRTGTYDLGVNRRRVENVRKRLKAAELIQ